MLHVHRSERADGLVVMLGDLVADPLADAMEPEIVAVPTRGVERWLTQQLSARLGTSPGRRDGVCANIEFPFPGSVVGAALALAGGIDPRADPWSPARSVWPLLEVVDKSLGEGWLAPLAAHLNNSAPAGETRRFASLRHIADLYDRYGVHRPQMLRAWLNGDADHPSAGWQPELWRRLRHHIGTPSPAERLVEACARLRQEPALLELPARLSLFGLTRLPASYLDVLDAIASGRDVHLFLLHPSAALWERLSTARQVPTRGLRRSEDPTAGETVNPLLESWGRDAREMQLVLRGAGDEPAADHHLAVAEDTDDLLHRLQADVRADRRPPGRPAQGGQDARVLLDPGDRSIQVHACHGRGRQVEVIRDAILHLLEEDPTLEPRDVIVMCPDIETFAPLIQATFGSFDPDDAEPPATADLRVRLADRSLRQTNPVLGVIAELLAPASGRVTATQVLDLAGREPVRRRFGFADEDLGRIEEWVVAAGVRWGLDADHRAAFKLEKLDANTWRAGLDRALLGVTMADERQRLFGGALPLDDMNSGDIELAGRLAELVDRLDAAISFLGETRPVDAWATGLADIADAFTATSEQDAWQRLQLQRLLDDLVDEATAAGRVSPVELSPADIHALLADRLRGRPTRANFRTGHLTICTLVPMRSVPHRVVCLLGLDDGIFPRHVERDGDDLIAADPHVGDNDARTEDRQLLLDALLAATDRLVVTYTARDERTNLARPPAVPLNELLDVIDATVRTNGGTAREHVVTRHPLQPFDVRNFTRGMLFPDRPWSFDVVNLAGAEASTRPREEPGPWLPGTLPELALDSLELDQLERFVRNPVGTFLRRRLGISLKDWSRDVEDALPIDLDALEQWGVAERILAARLAGAALEDCVASERARGLLPPGALASPIISEITPTVEELVRVGGSGLEVASLDVNVFLPGPATLVGTVPHLRGDALHTVSYSRLGPNHRLVAWARLLALTAAWPSRPFEAVTIGRARSGAPRSRTVSIARICPLAPDPAGREAVAREHLEALVDLFRRGMGEPLPLYCKTSAAWASARRRGEDGERPAGKAWQSEHRHPGEDKDAGHRLVLRGEVGFDRMLAQAGSPRHDESGAGWDGTEATRFGRYARRLWDGLLDHEELTDQ